MRAVQIIEQGKPLELREIPMPQPGEHEVRIRVEAAGMCHSDVHYRSGTASVARLTLMAFTAQGQLDLDSVIAERVPLDALASFRGHTRSVITP